MPARLLVGTGAYGQLHPDPEAIEELLGRGIEVEALPTAEAVRRHGELDPRRTAAALHLTAPDGSRAPPHLLMSEFALESSAFPNGQAIPRRHGCEGEDVSPPLRWRNVPEGTRSLALLVDDPDAPGRVFTHWIGWGLDPGADGLGEGERAPSEGRNDFGTSGYRGPCPPPGHGRHRYVFRLYALDAELELDAGAAKARLEQAIEGHVLTTAELVGTYER